MKATILAILFLSLFAVSSRGDQCKALVIEGGGDLGAYAAGVISGLVDKLPEDQLDWDLFSGISLGAVDAAILSQFAKSDTKNMAAYLQDTWESIKKGYMYKNWGLGIMQGLLFETGIYNNAPLEDFLKSVLTQETQRKLNIGACNANNGVLDRFDETLGKDDLIQALIASTSQPFYFPYKNINGTNYFDGGICNLIDIMGTVNRCREIADKDEDITIDVIFVHQN